MAAKINAVFKVNRTLALGAAAIHSSTGFHSSGGRLTAMAPVQDSPFTWGASTNAFTALAPSTLKAYTGFTPSIKDKASAELLKATLDRSAVVPARSIHPSALAAGAKLRANAKVRAGKSSYQQHQPTMAHLDLAALRKYTGFVPSPKDRLTAERFHLVTSAITPVNSYGLPSSSYGSHGDNSSLPKNFDWRKHSKWVSPVRNQGSCGTCWAVSATGAASDRAAHACMQKGGSPSSCGIPYASQTMISCAVPGFTCGEGSNLSTPYEYMRDTGIPPLADAPYTAGGGQVASCGASTALVEGVPLLHSSILGSSSSGLGSENASDPFRITPTPPTSQAALGGLSTLGRTIEAMKREIMTKGPITGGMTVFRDLMAHYSGEGVYQPISTEDYRAKGINFTNCVVGGHALEIVGWGVDEENGTSLPYWLVKNSWGTSWPKPSLEGASPDSTANTGYFKMIMYDGSRPIPTVGEIQGDFPCRGGEDESGAVLTFESTAHAALFPSPPLSSSSSSSSPPSSMPSMPSLGPANPLPFSPL